MDPDDFTRLAKDGYTRIPVMREILADLDTPLSAYFKLGDRAHSYLFESVQGGEQWGRYSFIGLPARTVVRVHGHGVKVETDGEMVEQTITADPLGWIDQFRARFRVPQLHGLPRFSGGLVGYFGYDTVRYVEQRIGNTCKPDPLDCPDIFLMVSEEILVFDNLRGKLSLIVHADPSQPLAFERAQERIDKLVRGLTGGQMSSSLPAAPRTVLEEDFLSSFERDKFEAAVHRIKDYILEGDVMQVVLSQRLSVPFHARATDLYRALRCLNPSPYLYYLNLGDFFIVGSSPEILVRLDEGTVTVRPIAGTRRRGRDSEEDLAFEQELLRDPKELAEHLMLIDLGRNDIGRVARIGTVQVTDRMMIERYSHVMHIVSNVTGRLDSHESSIDVLRATFPAGTVSGAPKVRAMEIIDELEPVKRGVYAGAVGYLSWSGNMDLAIAIRTALIKNGMLHVQAGAGIVADSQPALEWKETLNKGRAIFRAVAMAEAGLNGTKTGKS
ncbi:MAG: anthranilate synthase component I [Gammaproteobacteria bacterium]